MQDSPCCQTSLPELVRPYHKPNGSSDVLETALGRERYIYLLVCLYLRTYSDFISRNCFRGFPFSYRSSPSNALLPATQTDWQISPTAALVASWDTCPVSLSVCLQHGYPAVSLPSPPASSPG